MMREQDFDDELPGCSDTVHNQMNNVLILELAKEFHVDRNTVAKIAKKLSIQFKYENCNGKLRAYVYDSEADKIRQVLDDRYIEH